MLEITVLLSLFLPGVAVDAKPRPKQIKVVTVTDRGEAVKAKIRIKAYPEPEKDAYVLRDGKGFEIISVDQCDSFVTITAVSETIGLVRKVGDDVPDWLSCTEPEVTFNDFVVVPLTVSVDNPDFQQPDFWTKTLGDAAVQGNPVLAADIAEAFKLKQYGKVSIIATELERSVRASGKTTEADFLYALALDAGARGVLSQGGAMGAGNTLVYSIENDRFELKADVKAAISDYQIQNFNYDRDSDLLGKFTWKTMKSLPGGDQVFAPDFQLSPDALTDFNASLATDIGKSQLY
jgi:hypothetical protein